MYAVLPEAKSPSVPALEAERAIEIAGKMRGEGPWKPLFPGLRQIVDLRRHSIGGHLVITRVTRDREKRSSPQPLVK